MKKYVKIGEQFGICSDRTIIREDGQIVDIASANFEVFDGRNIPISTRKFLAEILLREEEIISLLDKERELKKEVRELEAELELKKSAISSLTSGRIATHQTMKRIISQYQEDEKRKRISQKITGTEQLLMSFYDGTLDETKASIIIEKSHRPLFFTYGYAYKNPTTLHVPISKQKALEILKKESFLDISFEETEIHLNAFSGNDML